MTDQYVPEGEAVGEGVEAEPNSAEPVTGPADDILAELEKMVAERTEDLQRLQAEYVNYKRRVDRDRDVARQRGVEAVLADLLPVLDGIAGARAHDDLTGGGRLIADELEKVAAKYGLEAYGAEHDTFDPNVHEALMHADKPGFEQGTVTSVFQPGFLLGDKVLRPARVAVAQETVAAESPADGAGDPAANDATAND